MNIENSFERFMKSLNLGTDTPNITSRESSFERFMNSLNSYSQNLRNNVVGKVGVDLRDSLGKEGVITSPKFPLSGNFCFFDLPHGCFYTARDAKTARKLRVIAYLCHKNKPDREWPKLNKLVTRRNTLKDDTLYWEPPYSKAMPKEEWITFYEWVQQSKKQKYS